MCPVNQLMRPEQSVQRFGLCTWLPWLCRWMCMCLGSLGPRRSRMVCQDLLGSVDVGCPTCPYNAGLMSCYCFTHVPPISKDLSHPRRHYYLIPHSHPYHFLRSLGPPMPLSCISGCGTFEGHHTDKEGGCFAPKSGPTSHISSIARGVCCMLVCYFAIISFLLHLL